MTPSKDLIAHCVEAFSLWYFSKRKMPTVRQIYEEHSGTYENMLVVQAIFESEEFGYIVRRRGIPYVGIGKTQQGLTARQMLVLQAVMSPDARGTISQRLKGTNTSYATWAAWMKNPTFKAYVSSMGSNILEESIPLMERQLAVSAEKGDLNAIKYAFEITGRYNPASQNAKDVREVLAAVIEVITKHVQDPDTLTRIGMELSGIAGAALPVAGSNVVQGELEDGKSHDTIKTAEASGVRPSFSFDGLESEL